MTVIGLDDTDSRSLGMCTTYAATQLAKRLEANGADVERLLLIRLLPSVEYKTRGNAAVAIHTDADPVQALESVERVLSMAETDDDRTNPGAVVFDGDPEQVPNAIGAFATRAMKRRCSLEQARELCDRHGFDTRSVGTGQGLVGAVAAVGAWQACDKWTYECISYRERPNWGTARDVEYESVVQAATAYYPEVWDTLDRVEETAVCVPRTPCPVLHGIRGDHPTVVSEVAAKIDGEPVAHRQLFVTNQGTDSHLQDGKVGNLTDGRCYRVDVTVTGVPETREGGHVFVPFGSPTDGDGRETAIHGAAFEPTKRFRDRVRALHPGDRLTVCGEYSEGVLNLEKFAVRELIQSQLVTPDCPECGRSMSSAGRNAGYRCRPCGTYAEGKVSRPLERDIEDGWYEVPPCARRHIAKPLVRGGFDGPTHPER